MLLNEKEASTSTSASTLTSTWQGKIKNEKQSKTTYAHETDKLFVADRLIGFVVGRRTPRSRAVAKGGITTTVVVSALDAVPQLTSFRAARALKKVSCRHHQPNDQ